MFTAYLKNLCHHQRGAMFGLDARIALAIIAGLSIIAGASMIQIMKDRRVDTLLFEQEKFASAVSAIQEDLEGNIHGSLTTANNANAFLALVDGTLLTAAMQNRWLGPYLRDYYSTNHQDYGVYSLAQQEAVITNACSVAEMRNRQCYYWLTISQVPLTVVNDLNTKVDGTGEGTPQNEGAIQWDTITATTARLYMRLGLSMAP